MSTLLVPGWLEDRFRVLGLDPEGIRRFRNALLKRGTSFEEAFAQLPAGVLAPNGAGSLQGALCLERQQVSKLDGATKLLFRNRAGLGVETVVMEIQSGRSAVCVSSQVGCAVRCAFCATGQAPKVQSLSSTEILLQILHAQRLLISRGRRLRNVVFMGMGEPLLNAQALFEVLEALSSPQHFDLSARHLLVSTVGIPAKMVRLAEAFPKVGIALSLHAAQAKVRNRIIPLAHRHDLESLHRAIQRCNAVQTRPVMIEYLLLAGVNDNKAAIDALVDFCRGLDVRMNLIPYNQVAGIPFERTETVRQDAIAGHLRAQGLEVTVRRSLGADIAAACGQLVNLAGVSKPHGLGQLPFVP